MAEMGPDPLLAARGRLRRDGEVDDIANFESRTLEHDPVKLHRPVGPSPSPLPPIGGRGLRRVGEAEPKPYPKPGEGVRPDRIML